MKISRLLQVLFVSGSAFVVVPGLAASFDTQPGCGGDKHEKTEKDQKSDKKSEKSDKA